MEVYHWRMDELSRGLIGSGFALAIIAPLDVWVYLDARRREREGDSVGVEVGSLRFDKPGQWLAGCLLLFVAFLPAYLVARNQQR